jgi:hypothetical protein
MIDLDRLYATYDLVELKQDNQAYSRKPEPTYHVELRRYLADERGPRCVAAARSEVSLEDAITKAEANIFLYGLNDEE